MNVHFEKVGEYRKFIGQKLFEEALSLRVRPRAILEIGPGTGDVLFELKSKGLVIDSEVTFLEPNKAATDALGKRFNSAVINSTLETAVRQNHLPARVDVVLANFSLHWVESLPEVLLGLKERMFDKSLIALSNTDVSRSFWAQIDRLVGQKFPGTSLFNIDQSHSMNRDQWAKLLRDIGFRVVSGVDYHGTASVFDSPQTALNDFRSVTGPKYLRLGPGVERESVESFVLEELVRRARPDGKVEVNASGFHLIVERDMGTD